MPRLKCCIVGSTPPPFSVRRWKLSGKFAPPDFLSVRHAHHTPSNTAESATPKAANVSMKQAHLPARFMPHGGVVRQSQLFFFHNVYARFYLTRGQCRTSQRALK